jgi:membrane complex biogenesis BtpA family protein
MSEVMQVDGLMRLFGVQKPVVAMMHFPGLPGRPLHDVAGGSDALLEPLAHDLVVLQEAGVDGLLFCNERDYPYQLKVGPEIPAAMGAIIGRLRDDIRVPFGVNILFDPIASLALARATGAAFIREVLTGVYESDLGIIEPHIGEITAYRSAIGAADVALFDNISPEFSSALGGRTLADRARGAAFFEMDAILISGWAAGSPVEITDLVAAKQAAPETPVIANTGVRTEHIAEILEVADGVIVGSSLKRDGITWNAVDRERAMRLMDAVRAFRARQTSA